MEFLHKSGHLAGFLVKPRFGPQLLEQLMLVEIAQGLEDGGIALQAVDAAAYALQNDVDLLQLILLLDSAASPQGHQLALGEVVAVVSLVIGLGVGVEVVGGEVVGLSGQSASTGVVARGHTISNACLSNESRQDANSLSDHWLSHRVVSMDA